MVIHSVSIPSTRGGGFAWKTSLKSLAWSSVDECEQVLWHLLESDTDVKNYRTTVLHNLRQLLTHAVRSGGQILLSDADLSDLSLNFVKQMAGLPSDYPLWLAVNEYQHSGWEVTNYSHSPVEAWYRDLLAAIASGERLFIATASQKPGSPFGTIALEAAISAQFPDKKLLRLDSETLGDRTHPAFGAMGHLNEVVIDYDIVLASPSLETGVSIDVRGHFSSVWAYSAGNLPPTNFVQMLWRVRDPVPRRIWTNHTGIGTIGNGSSSYKSLLTSTSTRARENLHLLREFDISPECIDGEIAPIATRAWARYGARFNAHHWRYRDTIAELLESQGHTLTTWENDMDKPEQILLREQIRDISEQEQFNRAQEEANAADIDDEKATELQEKRSTSPSEQRQLRKHILKKRYKVEQVTPELALADAKGAYRPLRLEFFLTVGRDALPERDCRTLSSLTENNAGEAFAPDVARALLSSTVDALDKIKAAILLDPDREWHKDDPDLVALFGHLTRDPQGCKRRLGFSPGKSAIAAGNQILGLFGRRLEYVRHDRLDSQQRRRVYRLAADDIGIDRRALYERWLNADLSPPNEQPTALDSVEAYWTPP
ncbi:MAG: hypothetical protein HC899_20200 [Leptolyngbyaceae cyanobacterium SM1_4_3]|nr:hypothetical protein [Leptolyngbyaceae cyanobacterium SM1_4_3]